MTIRPADESGIREAAEHLLGGHLVAFPTETVYGLGADATQDSAVEKIFTAKGRPSFNPLIVHVGNKGWLKDFAQTDDRVVALIDAFWPGPLTLVLPQQPRSPISKHVSAGLDTIAVRQPNHPVAAALLAAVNKPLAAPSANLSGHVSPTTADHVEADFGSVLDIILDGGACQAGLESTVLDLTQDTARILRPGIISAQAISAVIGKVEDYESSIGEVKSPGQLEKHYAPALPVRLNAATAHQGEAFMTFGNLAGGTANLSPSGDLAEAASNLFQFLRKLDDPDQFTGIAIAPIPQSGIGQAINDRLRRAARGR